MKKLNKILFEKINLLVEEFINHPQVSASQGRIEPKSILKDYTSTSHLDDIFHNDLDYEKIRERKIIDGSISFAENNLSKNDYHKFLLELAGIFTECNKMDYAEEVLTNLIGKVQSDYLKAESLAALADISIRKSKWDISITLINQAKDIYANSNDNLGIAKCENLLGTSYGERGELLISKNHFTNGLKLLSENPDEKLAAELETNLAIIENICGYLVESKEHFYNALNKFEKLHDRKKTAELHHNIGMLFLELKEYEKAINEFDKGLAIAIKENYKTLLSTSFLGKANVLLCLGNYNEASEYCYKAMDMAIKIEDKLTIADVYRLFGILEQKFNRYKNAEKYLQISLRLNEDLGNKLNCAESAFELALVYEKLGNDDKKINLLQESLNYYTNINAKQKIKVIEEMLQTELN